MDQHIYIDPEYSLPTQRRFKKNLKNLIKALPYSSFSCACLSRKNNKYYGVIRIYSLAGDFVAEHWDKDPQIVAFKVVHTISKEIEAWRKSDKGLSEQNRMKWSHKIHHYPLCVDCFKSACPLKGEHFDWEAS